MPVHIGPTHTTSTGTHRAGTCHINRHTHTRPEHATSTGTYTQGRYMLHQCANMSAVTLQAGGGDRQQQRWHRTARGESRPYLAAVSKTDCGHSVTRRAWRLAGKQPSSRPCAVPKVVQNGMQTGARWHVPEMEDNVHSE